MKKRILLILHMPPPVHGAAMVGKYIHDSVFINNKFECRYINLAMAGSLENVGRFSLHKVKLLVALLQEIRKNVKSFKPDLVYVTPNAKGGAFFKEYIIVQTLKGMGCKVVAHYHNKGVSTKQDQCLYNLLYKRFFKSLKVILLGKSLYQDVKKYVKWEDVYICPNGIPKEIRSKKEVVRGENPQPRLLFLSNLIESKGVIVLLDALKILKDQGYSFVCDFVGGETAEIDAKRFEQEAQKRGLNELVKYRGKKYGDEKERVLSEGEIFVFPTYYDNECFPLVLLEAMEHGLPCVTTTEGAIGDIIKDGVNGLVAEHKDANSLAEKIKLLLDDNEKRQRMGDNGYRIFKESFTIDTFENRFCNILQDLAG